MLKKRFIGFVPLLAVVALFMTGCTGEQVPGWEYMPDMYRSPAIQAYEPYEIFEDSLSALQPAQGTIPRGFMAYEAFDPGQEGYERAKANLTMPETLEMDSAALHDGAKLYGIYCGHCHGDEGDGQGILVQREKFLGVPSYADREITEGSVFHVITYGKGVMGSHAAQVDPAERWKITEHVLYLRRQLTGEGTDSAEVTTAVGEMESEDSTTEDANNEG